MAAGAARGLIIGPAGDEPQNESARYNLVYIPDLRVGRRFVLDGDVAADVADAEAALVRLDATAGSLADTKALACTDYTPARHLIAKGPPTRLGVEHHPGPEGGPDA